MLQFASLVFAAVVAQVQASPVPATPQPAPAPVVAPAPETLNTGPCLDSPRAVPQVLLAPAVRSMQILRIDRVVSTSTMMQNQVIGFLYTVQDGSTWLGRRTNDYMSGGAARALNLVLASTHVGDGAPSAFPPETRFGVVPTKLPNFYKVQIPPTSFDALHVRIDPCVAWPAGRQLPDPEL